MPRIQTAFQHATPAVDDRADVERGGPDAAGGDSGVRAAVSGSRVFSIVDGVLAAHRRRRGGEASGGARDRGLLAESELEEIEREHPDGLTAVQIVDVFASRGIRLSEASFRKYVQQGLLPRSRRVGRKGKHRGSMGVYPAKTVRRVNEIKRLMLEGYTIEEIQSQFLRFTDLVETLEESVAELFSHLDDEVTGPRLDNRVRRSLKRELAEARKVADELLRRLDAIAHQVTAPRGDRYRGTGAAGSAEDLL